MELEPSSLPENETQPAEGYSPGRYNFFLGCVGKLFNLVVVERGSHLGQCDVGGSSLHEFQLA